MVEGVETKTEISVVAFPLQFGVEPSGDRSTNSSNVNSLRSSARDWLSNARALGFSRTFAKDFDEFDGLFVTVKHELAVGNTAVDMIRRKGNKKEGMSRHRIPPMRERDAPILPTRRHNATML